MYAIPDIGGLLGSFINKAINGGASSTNNQPVVKGSFADMPMNAIINWKSGTYEGRYQSESGQCHTAEYRSAAEKFPGMAAGQCYKTGCI